jgi:hypothetical protein
VAMASPTSSCNSSHATPFSSSKFSSLPVMAMREKIVEKILENRVTLIVGETGCGTDTFSLSLSLRLKFTTAFECWRLGNFNVYDRFGFVRPYLVPEKTQENWN